MATKVSYRIEVTGQQASIQKLRPFANELGAIADQVDKLNKSVAGGPLEAFAKRLAAVVKDLQAANKSVGALPPASGGGGQPSAPSAPNREGETLTQELRRLLREAKDRVGETSTEYEALIQRVAELKAGQKEVTDEIRKQQRAFEEEAFQPGSYKAIQAEVGRLADQWRNLAEEQREGAFGRDLQRRIESQRQKLKDLDKQIGLNFRNVGNYRDAVRGLQNAFIAISSISVAGIGAREIIEASAAVSDSISDVRKTTGLGQKAVEGYDDAIVQLSEDLKGLDTRTSLADLLDISRVGGQLGIVTDFVDEFERLNQAGDVEGAAEQLDLARETLLGFTQVVDEVVVSLGEDLPGGVDQIARDFGRLNSLLNVEQEFGVEGGIRVLASAVNTLGASGEAAEGQIVDFLNRLAGLSGQANLSAGDLAGFAATFDEIGLSSEVTATAFTQFVLSLGSDVEMFAELAGTSVEDFRNLLETDVNEAILTLLDNLNINAGDVEGVERLQKILEPLGIDGARAAQAIGGLAGQTDLLRKRQEQANNEFAIARGEIEGTLSVTEEFNEKNNNLAASLDKIRNAFANSLTSPEIRESIGELTNQVVGLIPSLTETVSTLVSAGVAIVSFFTQAVLILKDFALVIGFLTAAVLIYNKELQAKLLLQAKDIFQMGVLSKITKTFTAVQRGLNLAMAANPIGFIITLVAGLIIGVGKLQERYEGLRDGINKVWRQMNEWLDLLGPFGSFIKAQLLAIRALIDAVSDGESAWAGFRAAVSSIFENLQSSFEIFLNRAKIFGKEIQQALSFDKAKDNLLQNEIDALEEANKRLEQSQVNIADAYDKAFKENQMRRAELEKQRAEGEAAAAGDSLTTSTGTNPPGTGGTGGTGGSGGRLSSDQIEEAKREAEEKARIRLEAERKLRDLQTALIADEFERSLQEVANKTEDEIKNLVGDPEQITAQADLLRQTLASEYQKIFEGRAEVIAENSAGDIEAIGNTNGLLPSVSDIQAAGEAASAALMAENDQLVELFRQRLLDQQVSEEDAAEQTEAFRADLREKESDQIAANNAELLNLQLQSIEQRRELEKAAEEQRLQERIAAIYARAAAEGTAREDIEEQIRQVEDEERLRQIDSERAYWEERARIATEGSLEYLRIQAELNALTVEREREANEQRLEDENRLGEGRKKALDISLGIAKDYVDTFSELLSADEERRKKYGAAIKALALAEIAINLAREISGINSNATINALPPPLPIVVKIAAIGAAVGKAIVQANKVRQQEFGEGGEVPGAAGSTKQRRPNSPPVLETGNIFGPSHSGGGVSLVTPSGEIISAEGGERYIQNGPEGYIINARSNRYFSGRLNRLQERPNVYLPERRAAASAMNSFRGWGRAFAAGGVVMNAAVTAPLRRASMIPEGVISQSAGSSLLVDQLKEQNATLVAGLQSIAKNIGSQPPTIVQNNNNPAEIVRAGLSELRKRENGITS